MTEMVNDDIELLETVDTVETDGADEGDSIPENIDEKIIVEKNDRSLFEFHNWYKKGRIVIDPEWQRSYVWDSKRASRLIESFLLDIPVPVIYLAKNQDGNYEVIDGVQRLTSVYKFFDGEFSLQGVELVPEIKGKKYNELSSIFQNKLQDTTLRTFELSPKSQQLLFIIFERLNTGGVRLNEMEIRNCIYRGALNNLIKKLSTNSDFIHCLNQKDISKRMTDRTLVLRFLAFYEKTPSKIKDSLKSFLNDFFENYKNPTEAKLNEFEKAFKHAMKASVTVFGDRGFRLRKRKEREKEANWTKVVNSAVFQVITVGFTKYSLEQITRRADSIFEEYIDLISVDNEFILSVTQSTGNYVSVKYAFDAWEKRLEEVMNGTFSNDSDRIFSRELKKEMFEQSNTCAICGQEIKLIIDAALDHDVHYWRGGKTVPSNARLVHRYCNSTREK